MENCFLKKSRILRLFLFLGLTFLSYPLYAQQSAEPAAKDKSAQSGKPIIVDAKNVSYLQEEGKMSGEGNVKIKYDDVVLESDKVLVDTKSKDAEATGNVKITYKGITMLGNKLFYNFNTKIGKMVQEKESDQDSDKVKVLYKDKVLETDHIDFNLESKEAVAPAHIVVREKGMEITGQDLIYHFDEESGTIRNIRFKALPWYGRARDVSRLTAGKITAKQAYVTTCDKENPHYRIQAKRFYIYPQDRIVAKNAVMLVGKVPVLYMPYWKHSLKDNHSNVTVSVGNKKEWGWFALSSWRYYINDGLKGNIHLDERELKGFAGGIDTDYKTDEYGQGEIKTYYMDERDKYYDDTDPRSQERERYRIKAKHRWQVDPSSLFLFEYNKLSDIDFIKDYLYREYEQDVQPVSETSFSTSRNEYNFSVYARKRTNDFYSEVERLPEIKLNVNSFELGDTNLYYRNELQAASLNKKYADSDIDTDANRLDTYQELKYPTKLPGDFDWINFTPYAGMRQTYYSKDLNGTEHDFFRGVQYYGFDMNTKFYRTFDYQGRPLGIEVNSLRHIITPSVKYNYIHNPTVSADKLGDFDSIDEITKLNRFTFGLENYLQTKWKNPDSDEMESVDLVYFYPHVDYVYNPKDDSRHFGMIDTELNVRPCRWWQIDSDSVYNQYQRRFDTANFDLSADGGKKWRLALGKRYDRGVSDQTTGDVFYRINRNWQVRTYLRYLADSDTFQEQQYTVYRDLHCWLLQVSYDVKFDENGNNQDRTIWFIFKLKAFPDESPIPLSINYNALNRI